MRFTLFIFTIILSFSAGHQKLFANAVKIDDQIDGSFMHVYMIPPPRSLNWETPSTLARTLLINTLITETTSKTNSLGHTNYELHCEGMDPIYAGMTQHEGLGNEGRKLLFGDKSGVGILYHNMAGRFDTKAEIDQARENFKKGRASILTLRFSKERCLNLAKYIENYLESGEQYNYGLFNNPFISDSKLTPKDKLEQFPQNTDGHNFGAGCSAFVVSSLQELKIWDLSSYKQWYSEVQIQEELIGKYSDARYFELANEYSSLNQKLDQTVSMWRIIFLNNAGWAKDDQKSRQMVYYDPELMFDWVNKLAKTKSVGDKSFSGVIEKIHRGSKNTNQVIITL